MAEWSSAYIKSLPDSAFADPADRRYPHHDRSGDVDLPHLRNALSRCGQDATDCSPAARRHLEAHARAEDVGETKSAVATAVKYVGPDTIEGPLFLYGSPLPGGGDVHGEKFAATTDLCIDWFGRGGRPLLYDHGLDGAMKTTRVGRQIEYEERDEGIWAQSQLEMNAKYRKAIDALIEQEALGYSGGAMGHLATKNARTGVLTRFPWVETSLTPIPANPANLGVHYVKSATAIAHLEDAGVDVPAPLKAALEALDDWAETREAPTDPEALADRIARVSSDTDALVKHATNVAGMRMKSGKVLSRVNRALITDLLDLFDGLDAPRAALRELITAAEAIVDEGAADPGKSALQAAMSEAYASRWLEGLSTEETPA